MENKKKFFVHSSSFIDDGVRIGDGTKIWHFCHILKGSRIGKNCILGQNVSVGPEVKIGDGCKIQNNVSIYNGVTLEDGVFCGPACVFTNVFSPRAFVERKHEFLPTLVKRGATIGANATILCGITIGKFSFIGAGAVITKDVGDYELVYGFPAKRQGWICECGEKLKFTKNKATCRACKQKYAAKNTRVAKIS
jgi:UDP-2-acetamido-3-amino-2,3-dideoxy-glucuronate N-acetyltransferase